MGVIVHGWTTGVTWPRVTRTVVTPPSDTPLSLEEAKAFSRIETNAEDDVLLLALRGATKRVEGDTGLALMTQTIDLRFDGMPPETVWDLPIGPVQSVTSVKYTDTDGVEQTVDAADYIVSGSRIGLADDAAWPTDYRTFAPTVVRVVAGYASADLVPDDLKLAVALVFGWVAAHREPTQWEMAAYEGWITGYKRVLVA